MSTCMEEYESLEPPNQKQYLSTVVRFCLAQQSAARNRGRQTTPSHQSSTHSAARSKSARHSHAALPTPSHGLPSYIQPGQARSLHDEALWYLSLPDKARRQILSREEREQLFELSKKLQLHPPPKVPRKHSVPREPKDQVPNEPSLLTDPSVEPWPTTFWCEEQEGDPPSTHVSHSAATKTEILALNSDDSDSAEPLHASSPTLPRQSLQTRNRKSCRRKLSLTPLALPPPTLAPVHSVLPSPVTRSMIASSNVSRPPTDAWLVPREFSSFARDGQGLDAREGSDLDTCPSQSSNGSIGFSNSSDETIVPPSAPTASSVSRYRPSSWFDENDEDLSSVDTKGPSTPKLEADHHNHAMHHFGSSGSGLDLHSQFKFMCDDVNGGFSLSGLNNPIFDIRRGPATFALQVLEERPCGFHRVPTSGGDLGGTDLLALEALHVCDDLSGAQGAFAVPPDLTSKPLMRVWKGIRRF